MGTWSVTLVHSASRLRPSCNTNSVHLHHHISFFLRSSAQSVVLASYLTPAPPIRSRIASPHFVGLPPRPPGSVSLFPTPSPSGESLPLRPLHRPPHRCLCLPPQIPSRYRYSYCFEYSFSSLLKIFQWTVRARPQSTSNML